MRFGFLTPKILAQIIELVETGKMSRNNGVRMVSYYMTGVWK